MHRRRATLSTNNFRYMLRFLASLAGFYLVYFTRPLNFLDGFSSNDLSYALLFLTRIQYFIFGFFSHNKRAFGIIAAAVRGRGNRVERVDNYDVALLLWLSSSPATIIRRLPRQSGAPRAPTLVFPRFRVIFAHNYCETTQPHSG